MIKELTLYDNIEMREWDDFVNHHPLGTPFHLSSWIKVIHETYSFKPVLVVSFNTAHEITGLVPFFMVKRFLGGKRIVSIPFSDYCYPLTDGIKTERLILENIIKRCGSEIKSVEIRGPITQGSKFSNNNNYHRFTLELDIDPMKIYKTFEKRTIVRSIKKAEKDGIKILENSSAEGIREFIRLNKLNRRKHGVPSQSDAFFYNIDKYMISQGTAFIVHAKYGSDVIAASMFLRFNKSIFYKYNASDPAALLKKTPNHLLFWHVVKKACIEGYHTFDFGRVAKNNKGLFRHKLMWGAKSHDFPYYYYPIIQGAVSKEHIGLSYKLFTGIWRRLPCEVANRVSPIIMKLIA